MLLNAFLILRADIWAGETLVRSELAAGPIFEVTKDVQPPESMSKEDELRMLKRLGSNGYLAKPESIEVYRALVTGRDGERVLWSKRVPHYSGSSVREFVLLDTLATNTTVILCYKSWDKTWVETLRIVQSTNVAQAPQQLIQDDTIRPKPVFVTSARIICDKGGIITIELNLSQNRLARWICTQGVWNQEPVESEISPAITLTSPTSVDLSVIRGVSPTTTETNASIRGRVWPRSCAVFANGVPAKVNSNGVWMIENLPIQPGTMPLIRLRVSLSKE